MPKPIVTADDRLNALPTEALVCRERGHAWPRPNSTHQTFRPTKTRLGRAVEAEREMECEGGCGRIRMETFDIQPSGRMARVGYTKYRQRSGTTYLLTRPEGVETPPRVDREEVRYALLTRMFPDLRW
jgi:hypothetical protein